MKYIKKKKIFLINEKGMTLIELMIALTLLATGLLAIGQLQIAAIQGNGNANRVSQAITLASDRMEKLIKVEAGHSDLGSGTHDDPNNPLDGFCNISWNVNLMAGGARHIQVIARWKDFSMNEKQHTLEYIRAD